MKAVDIQGRDFLALKDYSSEEIEYLLDLSAALKKLKKNHVPHRVLEGQQVALIFEKTSTRTRCAFEVAAHDLGMQSTYLDPKASQLGKKESIADTARVLSTMFEGIEYRGYEQARVQTLADYASVPVWNGLTNEFHPTQMLADLLTIKEHFGSLKGKKFVYFGDARYNTGNSLMIACAKMGMHFVACSNHHYFPDAEMISLGQKIASCTGASITLTTKPEEAAKDADVIATDVWVSMGEPEEVWVQRVHELLPYRVTAKIMKLAHENAIFMHCLPAFHDENTEIGQKIGEQFGLNCLEVENEVFESKQSVVFEEAGNRMHTIKAVMLATLAAPEAINAILEA